MRLYIYGSGGNGCELCDIAESVNQQSQRWEAINFVDDVREERQWYHREVYRFEEMLDDDSKFECVISLGEPAHRQMLYEKLVTHDVSLATLIHPTADVSPNANIGPGCVIGSRSFVSSNTTLNDNVMLEVHTIIGHDINIGRHSVISSCSVVGGGARIGDESFVGLNCTIKEDANIGNHCIIGMGSSVFKDIEDGFIALGNPARPMRKNDDRRVFKK